MNTIKALALGHYEDAKYHPFQGVDKELELIFKERIDVACTDRYDKLETSELAKYRLFISFAEFMEEQPLPATQVAALLSYVANGGGLLAIHNGISLQRNDELACMLGGRFTSHPPLTTLPITPTDNDHPILHGLDSFAIDDEPYRFDMNPLMTATVLAEYEHEGRRWPAAWAHSYGLGRVVYLMPGHGLSSFSVEAYRRFILNAGLWAAGQKV
jgi:type 1 glutamine amidotransferase